MDANAVCGSRGKATRLLHTSFFDHDCFAGAAFLFADLGITPEIRDDHAAYLAHWLQVLKEDKRAIFSSAARARRAADFLHGLQPQAQQEETEPVSAAA
jgi:antirestriction protein ArdC